MKKIDLKNKKVRLFLVLAVCVLLIGGTYAYWRLTLTQTGVNEIASSCFDITLTNEQNDINLQRAYPISDEEGMSLTPYTFTITNNCDTFASYSVNLELLNTILEEDRLSAGFVKVMLDENTPVVLNTNTSVEPTLDNAYEAYELGAGYLDANESVTYNLRLWMDGAVTVEDDAMNKQLESKITITASYIDHIPTDYEKCVAEYGEDSIQCSILAQVDTTGACPTVNDDETVNVTDIEDTESLVCSAPDDYGTSYYFRGNVENNYVKFAGFYWRILRINGDGSIRMIYAGDASIIDALDNKTEVLANGYDDSDTDYTQIGTSYYNYRWKKDNVQENTTSYVYYDNAAFGYMYGNRDGIVEGSSEYYPPTSHSNTTTKYYADSYTYNPETDKFTLNNPVGYTGAEVTSDLVGKYTMNSRIAAESNQYVLKVTSVATGNDEATIGYSYVTFGTTSKENAQENINDSTIKEAVDTWYRNNIANHSEYIQYISDTLFCGDRSFQSEAITSPVGTYSQLGYGTERTGYNSSNIYTLYCTQQNDRFTVNDRSIGNGSLTYPVGLLTSGEVVLAGGYYFPNSQYYLYTGNDYWTMSPSVFDGEYAQIGMIIAEGEAITDYSQSIYGIRPVINLKPNSLKFGDGSALNPYTVEENI